jgi:transmembrane sensor
MSRAQEARDRAAEWIIAREQDDWDRESQAALDAWLAESAMNKAAYWRLDHSWREADRIGALGGAPYTGASSERRARRGWVPAAMAASVALLLGFGALRLSQPGQAPEIASAIRYDTAIGATQAVGLSDGSKVQLNTASTIRAAIADDRREIWLDQGEAYFEVAHLEGRPFVVHAGNHQVTVIGTKFSVRRDGDKVQVSVLEGRVRVDDLDRTQVVRSTIISGGDIALAEGPATLSISKSAARVEDALAWRDGMLSFDQQRLGDVAAEFNRYNRRKMVVTDPEAADIRIGGMFPASKPDSFVRLLRDAYGLKIEESTEEVRISN